MKWALLAVALAACIEPSLTPCGDLVCPQGSVCVDNLVCATEDQITACNGATEKDPCQGPFGQGYCSQGVCVANVCGDNQLTGNESCDGDQTSVSCASFGFYEGTTSCSQDCVPEAGTCSGQCGDNVVQAQFGEQCDGTDPTESCLDFGRDYGVLTCNEFCAPAITNDCNRYGWEQLLPATTLYSAAAANARGVVGITATTIDVVWDGVASSRANTGSWTHAASNAGVLVLVGQTSVAWFDGQWHDMSAGITNANWVSVSEDGFVFGRNGSGGCVLERVELANAAKTTLPAPAQGCTHGVALATNRLYVSQAGDGVRVWDGAGWSSVVTGTVSSLVQAGPEKLAALGPSTLRMIDVSTASPTVTTRIGVAAGTDVFDDDGNQLRAFNGGDSGELVYELRAHDLLFELPELVEDSQTGLARAGDGRILTFGAGVRGMRPLQMNREIPSNPTIRAIARAGNGLIACGSDVFLSGLAGLVARPYNSGASGDCVAVTGDSLGAHFVLSEDGGVYRYNAGNNSYETVSTAGSSAFTDIAGDFTQLYIATSAGILGSAAGGVVTSETVPANCTIAKLAMSPSRTFVGVGYCGNTLAVFKRTTSWETIVTSTLAASQPADVDIAIGTDETIVVRLANAMYRVDGVALTMIGTGNAVDIVTANDIFIDQGSDEMLHVTPTRSQVLRLASGPFTASATHLFAWDRSRRSIVGIARVTGQPDGL